MSDILRGIPISVLEGDLPECRRDIIDEVGRGWFKRAVLFEGLAYWVVGGSYGACFEYPRGFTVDLERIRG